MGNSDRMEVANPCVIIGGYSQPEPFIETYLNLTSRNDGFPDRLLLSTPPSVALHEEEIDEWNDALSQTYNNVKLSHVYSFIHDFHEASVRVYCMSDDARAVYRKYANEIADKLNEQWRERKGVHGKMSKDKKTVLHLALNLHVLYFALGEEIAGRMPTTVPMVITAETVAQAVELTKYFAAQRSVYEKCCDTLTEKDQEVDSIPEDMKTKILLHTGPFVKPRNMIRKLPRGSKTETVVDEMRSLQELGYGTLHCRGAVQKVFFKVLPTKLPTENPLQVDRKEYEQQFVKEDSTLPRAEAAIFRALRPDAKDLELILSS
ncbi:hypothetical protein QZH41_002107 [Actinostola sp. cb2023]|nr:hypothetical protein QZH41_002107 [Actinostola sp. cb2023]